MNSPLSLLRSLALFLSLAVLLPGPTRAQEPVSDSPLTQPQLDQLLGPIALYPDALVALILPASTVPADIVLAARYLNAAGAAAEIDSQPWNDSVKALAWYPELIKWMDENLAWTQQTGSAFVAQPADVMSALQRLRARARATGALVTTPQQQVVDDDGAIEIVPTQPEVIYVPRYDPDVVYVPDPDYYGGPLVTFGYGFPTGYWLRYDLDWRRRSIWVGDRRQGWYRPGAPGRPNFPTNPDWHPWKPPVRPPLPPVPHRPRPEVVRPRPFPGTPPTPRKTRPDDRDRASRPETTGRSTSGSQPPVNTATSSTRNPSGWNDTSPTARPSAAPAPEATTSPSRTPSLSRTPTQPPVTPNRTPQVRPAPGTRTAAPAPTGTSTPAAVPAPSTPPATTSRDNAPR